MHSCRSEMTVVCTGVVIMEVQEARFQVHFEERADIVLCVTKEELRNLLCISNGRVELHCTTFGR